jgi:hypothetical protein
MKKILSDMENKTRRLKRNFVPIDLHAETKIAENYLKDLQMQAKAHDIEFDFMMARILELGLVSWSTLTPPEVEWILNLHKKPMSSSLLLGDRQTFNERRIN